MARKVLIYTMPVRDDDRDGGKTFVITEMPATVGQDWALRAFLALARNGVQVPDEVKEMGMAGLVKYGFDLIGKLPYEDAKMLKDELMGCVAIRPNQRDPNIVRRLVEEDIEEIATRFKLTMEAFRLHVNFSKVAKNSIPESSGTATETQG